MKISTLFVAGIAAITALSGAVIQTHGGQISDHMAMLAKHLNLSPAQEKQLKSEHVSIDQRMKAIDADTKMTPAEKAEAKKQLHNEMMSKATSILNAEQMAKVNAFHKFMGGQGNMIEMMTKLSLTPTQKDAIHQIMLETSVAMGKIDADTKLTPVQREEKAKELHNSAVKKMQALLTPEQIKKAKSLHKGGHGTN